MQRSQRRSTMKEKIHDTERRRKPEAGGGDQREGEGERDKGRKER